MSHSTLDSFDLKNKDVIHGLDDLVESVSRIQDTKFSIPILNMEAFMDEHKVRLKEIKRRFES